MSSPTVSLPLAKHDLRCRAAQCDTCVIYKKWCAGWETCCGGNFSDMQYACQGQCDACLGMLVHKRTWNVCGKPDAMLRPSIKPDLQFPRYTVGLLDDLPAYVPVYERLPRGPLRDLPQLPVAGLSFQDLADHRLHPEKWLKYVRKPIVVVSEQDYLQHDHEGWFPTWIRRARAAGHIWLATCIEFSCYEETGNFSHFWSIQRTLKIANKARCEFVGIPPRNRLLIDDVVIAWMQAVPNIFMPFPFESEYDYRKLKRWVAAVGGWSKVRILLAHMPINALTEIPREARKSCVWLDQSVMSTAIAGGHGAQDAGKTKPEAFAEMMQARMLRAEQVLRKRA